ncbi:hypothetical protein OG292_13475 [Streptomyces sp. NBC_01511]|uniref:hypothetical protein n=1 Tax=unclassified Streptomyces TaxID=2593676 RepID=UPI003867FA2B
MSDRKSTSNSDDLLVSVEEMGNVHNRACAGPLDVTASDIAWNIIWLNTDTEIVPRI